VSETSAESATDAVLPLGNESLRLAGLTANANPGGAAVICKVSISRAGLPLAPAALTVNVST
jgi:hypothetical protein